MKKSLTSQASRKDPENLEEMILYCKNSLFSDYMMMVFARVLSSSKDLRKFEFMTSKRSTESLNVVLKDAELLRQK